MNRRTEIGTFAKTLVLVLVATFILEPRQVDAACSAKATALPATQGGPSSFRIPERAPVEKTTQEAASRARNVLVDTYTYDAWGVTLASSGGTENAYRHSGQQEDADVGGYYLRARYYRPAAGRFLSEDSLDGSILSYHKYLYATNNPINRSDPSGRADTLISTLTSLTIKAVVILAITSPLTGLVAGIRALLTGETLAKAADAALEAAWGQFKLAFGLGVLLAVCYILSTLSGLAIFFIAALIIAVTVLLIGLVAFVIFVIYSFGAMIYEALSGHYREAALHAFDFGASLLMALAASGVAKGLKAPGVARWLPIDDFVNSLDGQAKTLLTTTNDADPAAQALADRIGGQASVLIEGFGNREFDAVSGEYVAQTSKGTMEAHNYLNPRRRAQIKATIKAAQQLHKKAKFEFRGQPAQEIIDYIKKKGDEAGVEVDVEVR